MQFKFVFLFVFFLFNFSEELNIKPNNVKAPVRSDLMYPYFDEDSERSDYQSGITESSPESQINLDFAFPFFGVNYNYTRVSLHGMLAFSDPGRDHITPIKGYPRLLPEPEWPEIKDPAFMGIFNIYSVIGKLRDEDPDRRQPGVYFRSEANLLNRTDEFGVQLRDWLKWDIREGMIGANKFEPNHAIITTWKSVSFAGGINNSEFLTNTYQIVIASDGIETYALFNYLDINWTSCAEAGADPRTGLEGVSAFVGFNAGNGTGSYEYIPYSQTSKIGNLLRDGHVNNLQGRHIFKISDDVRHTSGTCQSDPDAIGPYLPLIFAPKSGNMLGGTVVNITGPCFFNVSEEITCQFDGITSKGIVVDVNRAFCVQPTLNTTGYVRLRIQVGTSGSKWTGDYYSELPSTSNNILLIEGSYEDRNATDEFLIEWTVDDLLISNDGGYPMLVNVGLYGYRENASNPEFVFIDDLCILCAASWNETKKKFTVRIYPTLYHNRNNTDVLDAQFGFIQINRTIYLEGTADGANVTSALWSEPIPLSWYFDPQWERNFGTEWPELFCDEWIESDQNLESFTQNLPKCPCTLEQALVDKATFMTDPSCDKDSSSSCHFHQAAQHCVRSRNNPDGSAQECCFDQNSLLMLSQDQVWGSDPQRSHEFGSESNNKLPTLSHWYHDIVPKYVCCLWQDEDSSGCRTLREDLRPSDDCVDYEAPGIASVFGDPHIVTFDDVEYSFNGLGEFVLVRSFDPNFRLDIQGRFEKASDNSSRLTSVVIRGNTTATTEIRIPTLPRNQYKLDVIIDYAINHFDNARFLNFPGVTVYQPSYILNQSHVLVLLDDGVGLEVIENNGYISAQVYLSQNLRNASIRGLLGTFSGDGNDDFTLPTDEILNITSLNEAERIYDDFGLLWMLEDSIDPLIGHALFLREYGRTSATYNDPSFRPQFSMRFDDLIPEDQFEFRLEIVNLCTETNLQCRYDYALTHDKVVGSSTIEAGNYIKHLKEVSKGKVVSCGFLETPQFGHKSTFNFLAGAEVFFECDVDYVLEGDSRRECLQNGNWSELQVGVTTCVKA